MEIKTKVGWIEVICGCMFAGKTEELIRRVTRILLAKKDVVVFKPTIDDRYSKLDVVSHNRRSIKAVNVQESHEIDDYFKDNDKLPYAICIDEAQFFDDGIVDVVEKYANSGARVIVAGLDLDFRGEPFGAMPEIIARAEYVTKLHAICQKCGEEASFTQRIINGRPAHYNDPIIVVGETEKYEARCRQCHEVPRN